MRAPAQSLSLSPGLLVALLVAGPAAAMTLTSADVKDGAPIPAAQIYPRCGGQNISPELAWSGAPPAAKSFVVTMIDLSVAPNDWSHWILIDIPPRTQGLARGMQTPPPGASNVTTDFGEARYGGPCPPPGTGVHRYEITVWAMPTPSVRFGPGAPAKAVRGVLAESALDHASIIATAGK